MRKQACGMVFLVLLSLAAWSETVDVYPRGNLELQQAIDQAGSGDTIQVTEGIYRSDAALRVEGKQDLRIEADGEVWIICTDVYQDVIAVSGCSGVELVDLHARHEEWLPDYQCNGAVVSVIDSSRVEIISCELNGCGAMGAYVQDSDEVTVSGCHIHKNSYTGVYLYMCGTVYITDNTITDNGTAITATDVSGLEMFGNIIAYNTGI